jgi:hypothetical protein
MEGYVMLGINYQAIFCKVKKCKYNKIHKVFDGDDVIVEIYYTCEKDEINIDSTGKCKQ